MKDYYKEIDKHLLRYEENGFNRERTVCQIADRIDWCWKFRKITESQMHELCDRATRLFKRGYM